jgi:hypothetical protein
VDEMGVGRGWFKIANVLILLHYLCVDFTLYILVS